MTLLDFTLRLTVATLAGIIIGFERQWYQKSAGLRTNGLVAMGSCIFVLVSIQAVTINGDVTRIIGQVVTGVGFLGAGIIFKEGTTVHGLTTSATIWCSAAIGSIAALGFFIEALICVIAVLIVNLGLSPLHNYLNKRKSKQ